MNLLGLACFSGESAVVLFADGVLKSAAKESWFSRKAQDDGLPVKAINHCLQEAGITINEIAGIPFFEKPYLEFFRVIWSFLVSYPFSYIQFMEEILFGCGRGWLYRFF